MIRSHSPLGISIDFTTVPIAKTTTKGGATRKRSRIQSRRVLLPQLIQKPFAVGGHFPRLGPKTQIDAPPVVRHAAVHHGRDELVEVELAGAERIVRARVVLVDAAVGVDEMNVGDLALELFQQFQVAARQRLFVPTWLAPMTAHMYA